MLCQLLQGHVARKKNLCWYGDEIRLQKGAFRGIFLANHLASTDNLTSNNQETEHMPT